MSETENTLAIEAALKERDNYDLFKDAGIRAIVSKIPEQERKDGQKKGAYLYDTDYSTKQGDSTRYIDLLTFIQEGMKSGLSPSQLEDEERALMREKHGEKWYEQYGHSSEQD